MSGWASLSGYLYLKPGGGGLSLLKTRRRLWCVLDESQGRLLYFKNEEDSRGSKLPVGHVELRGAAITLDMDNHNQFVIIVDGKELLLTAENHESMMIWMMALQARRDQYAQAEKSRTSSTSTDDLDPDHSFLEVVESRERVGHDLDVTWGNGTRDHLGRSRAEPPARRPYMRSSSDLTVIRIRNNLGDPNSYTTTNSNSNNNIQQLPQRHHRPLEATQSLQGQVATVGFLGQSPDWRREQLRRMGETTDGHAPVKMYCRDRSRSLTPLLEESVLSFLHTNARNMSAPVTSTESLTTLPMTGHKSNTIVSWSASSTDTSDEVGSDISRHLPAVRSASAGEILDSPINEGPQEPISEEPVVEGGRVSDLERELIATKCELAKVLNRQSCYQEILKQKDEIIEDLDEKLGSRSSNPNLYDSKKRVTAASKEHQERVRVLQNQNRFLNEEVRRLAKLRGQEHDKIKSQEGKVRSLEADIEVWKLEYISLIQSSIRFTGTDTMDDAELSLFGGDRHKHRILSLLDEARKINPSLPTYEHLASGEVHVDCYGFKHHFTDDGLLLHYLCQELSQHFLSQASSYEKHQKNWQLYLKNKAKNLMAGKKDLKPLVRAGIPDQHRKQMWRVFVMYQVEDIIIEKGAHYFRSLCSAIPDSPMASRYRKQISLDLMRTMPGNIKFSTPGSKGIMDLQDVLLAFCIHNPSVGYCQGMNFLVAMALLFMDAQDAFWTLVALTERYHTPSYFDHNLLGAQADQMVLHDLMAEKLPELAKHLDAIDIDISTVTLNWFLAVFFDALPFHTLLRVWDCFLLEGPKVLFRFSLAILDLHSREIILKCDTISVMRHLKICARVTYDVDGLVRAAFKTLKPFPRRQDIVSKQICYLNALKEKYRWRDMQRVAFTERENLFLSMEAEAGHCTGFECCVVSHQGEAWVAYGEESNAKICVVDCREQTMTDTQIVFDTRVMSMAAVDEQMVLVGTLSWFVYAYSQQTRELLWQQRVHETVLSMQVYKEDDHDDQANANYRLFAALADGTVAVLETISKTCTNYDPLYLPIGQSPVTCVQLVGSQLWCACANSVSILHASTLDPMDRFTVSANPYDTVLSLVPGLPGVWVSVRGSSVLELWDPMSLSCKMLYDTRTGRYPNLRKEDDTYFNAARITSILALDHSVWVGTGEGTLITFDVFTQRPSSDLSPLPSDAMYANTEVEDQSWGWSIGPRQDCDSFAQLLEVERRVKDLYVQRLSEEKLDKKKDLDKDNDDNVKADEGIISTEEEVNTETEVEEIKPKVEENNKNIKSVPSNRRSRMFRINKSLKSSNDKEQSTISPKDKNKSMAKTDSASSVNKPALCKATSVDSAVTQCSARTDISTKTDTSTATSISIVSSNLSQTEGENFTHDGLHDSGFTQTSGRSSRSSSQTDNSMNDTLKEATSHEEAGTSVCTSPMPPDLNSASTSNPTTVGQQDIPTNDQTPGRGVAKTNKCDQNNMCTDTSKHSLSIPDNSGHDITRANNTEQGVTNTDGDEHKAPCSDLTEHNTTSKDNGEHNDTCMDNTEHIVKDTDTSVQNVSCVGNTEHSLTNTDNSQTSEPDSLTPHRVDKYGRREERQSQRSEDSGFYSLTDKSIDNNNTVIQNKSSHPPLERNNSFDRSKSTTEEPTNKSSTMVDEENLKNKFLSSSAGKAQEDNGLTLESTTSNNNNHTANGVGNEQCENGTGKDGCQDINKISMSLESNGRSESQESSKTTGSDDVFRESFDADSLHQKVLLDEDLKTSLKLGNSDSMSRLDLPAVNTSPRQSSDCTYTNGHSDGSVLSDEEEMSRTPKKDSEIDTALTFAGVKTLAAKFEASADKEPKTPSKTSLRHTKSLCAHFRPSIRSKILAEELQDENEDLSNIDVSANSYLTNGPDGVNNTAATHNHLSPNDAGPAVINDSESSNNSTMTPSPCDLTNSGEVKDTSEANLTTGHLKLQRLNSNSKLHPELRAAILQLDKQMGNSKLGQSLPNNKKLPHSEQELASNRLQKSGNLFPKAQSQPQLHADTNFYVDSDEDSCVHEARVQSFKDSYRRLSARTNKANALSDSGSVRKINQPGMVIKEEMMNGLDDTDQSRQDGESSGSSAGAENVNRKYSGGGMSSSLSSISKRMSTDSSVSSISSFLTNNINSHDPSSQMRLDYTNLHVETDKDSMTASCDGDVDDSLPPSRRLSALSVGSEVKYHRMNQFLTDTTSFLHSGTSGEDSKLGSFLPGLNGGNSGWWSSYDEISTPSLADGESVQSYRASIRFPRSSNLSADSRTTSIASTMDLYYGADLSLLSKNKISDKPVKWLVSTLSQGKPVILSFSGGHSDDEAVLIWSREANETLWTNSPVFEYNPTTRMATLPRYMRTQLSSSSSKCSSPRQRPASLNSNP